MPPIFYIGDEVIVKLNDDSQYIGVIINKVTGEEPGTYNYEVRMDPLIVTREQLSLTLEQTKQRERDGDEKRNKQIQEIKNITKTNTIFNDKVLKGYLDIYNNPGTYFSVKNKYIQKMRKRLEYLNNKEEIEKQKEEIEKEKQTNIDMLLQIEEDNKRVKAMEQQREYNLMRQTLLRNVPNARSIDDVRTSDKLEHLKNIGITEDQIIEILSNNKDIINPTLGGSKRRRRKTKRRKTKRRKTKRRKTNKSKKKRRTKRKIR
jgi:hypothetical protein